MTRRPRRPEEGRAHRYHGGVLRLEFTIEPFVEGRPGPHVLSAVAAAEQLGVMVEFGPFGSACTVDMAQVGHVVAAVVDAAVANGATNVTLDIARLPDEDGAA